MVEKAAIQRGEIWWADLPEPRRPEPGYRRPVFAVQAGSFNRSRIQTVIIAAITTNRELAGAPGNVVLPMWSMGLPRDSVLNFGQLLTVDRSFLGERVGALPPRLQRAADAGLRMVLEV